jgi:hypothetical protein
VIPLNLYARVRISLCVNAHETAGAARTRSSLRPRFLGGGVICKPRAHAVARTRLHVRRSIGMKRLRGCDKSVPAYSRRDGVGRCHVAGQAGLHAVLVQLSTCLILHCNKMTKRSLLKGQWHFRRHVCIGAAGKIWGLR